MLLANVSLLVYTIISEISEPNLETCTTLEFSPAGPEETSVSKLRASRESFKLVPIGSPCAQWTDGGNLVEVDAELGVFRKVPCKRTEELSSSEVFVL